VTSPEPFTIDELSLCAALRHVVKRREAQRRWNANNQKRHLEHVYKWRKQNPKLFNATSRAYRKANRALLTQNYKAWKLAHPEATKAHARNWARKHPAFVKQNLKRWRTANPLKAAEQGNRRRARKQGALGTYTAEQFEALGKTCLCCRRNDIPMTADHIIPLSKGGSNYIDNIQPLCLRCNSSKGTKSIDYRG